MEQENFKYIILPEYITKDKNLTDKEKSIYSMILTLSKNHECIMSNSYISSMLNISKLHASRLVSSLRDKGYIKVKIIIIGDMILRGIIAILILLNFMRIIFRKV